MYMLIYFLFEILTSEICLLTYASSLKLLFKKNCCLDPNFFEVIRFFPEAIRNFTVFRFPAKNDQMTKRKYHTYIYHFVAYLMLLNAAKT